MHPLINYLFKCRIEQGLSKTYCAELLGVSINTLKAWENGVSSPKLNDLDRWCRLFGLKLNNIIPAS